MASISASGFGSGLDITGIVTQLVAAEGDPAKLRLDRRESRLVAELSAIGILKAALSEFEASLDRLDAASDFDALSATSSNEELFTASAGGQAVPGYYEIEVTQLAQRHKLASGTFATTNTFGGNPGDSLTLTVDGQALTVDLSTAKNLAEIRYAIDSAEDNPGIVASLVNVDDGHQTLVLTSQDPGYQNLIEVSESPQAASLAFTKANLDATGNPFADLTQLDASLFIDGIEIHRSSNRIADAIDEVTLTLNQAEPGTRAQLTVDYDQGAIVSAVSNFVDKYNALLASLDQVSGYKGEDTAQPVLFGDAMTRTLGSRLRSEIGQSLIGIESRYANLAEIGITTKTDGTLELDRGRLNQALTQDREAVAELFASSEGIASQLAPVLSSYTGTGGVLTSRNDGVQARLDDIGDRRVVLERRLATLEQRYLRQFNALDALVGQLTATSDFLTQQLDNLPGAWRPREDT
jgi:flagellar hook-associated protein 2